MTALIYLTILIIALSIAALITTMVMSFNIYIIIVPGQASPLQLDDLFARAKINKEHHENYLSHRRYAGKNTNRHCRSHYRNKKALS